MTKLGREIIRILETDAESFSVKVEFDDGAVIDIRMGHIFEKPKGLAEWARTLSRRDAQLGRGCQLKTPSTATTGVGDSTQDLR